MEAAARSQWETRRIFGVACTSRRRSSERLATKLGQVGARFVFVKRMRYSGNVQGEGVYPVEAASLATNIEVAASFIWLRLRGIGMFYLTA